MIDFLLGLATGLVVGVIYHVALRPYVEIAWAWAKGVIGRIGVRRDAE